MLENQTIQTFSKDLISKKPVPGGGGASALAGALAACLGGMATNLTIGKKKFVPIEPMLKEKLQLLEQHRQTLLSSMEEDALAFEPLSKAYGLPANTEEEIAFKQKTLEQCLWQAAQPPMKILRIGTEVVEILCALRGNISKLVQSDLGCAAAMARACVHCAAMNVWINAQLLKDQEKANELYQQSKGYLEKATEGCDRLVEEVEASLWRH